MKSLTAVNGRIASWRGLGTLLLMCGAAVAQAQVGNVRFFAGGGLTSGGEVITAGTITQDGTGKVIPYEIKPVGSLQLRLGVDYRVADRFALQASIGYASTAPMGYNGSLTFTTMPVELLGFYNITPALRVGLGPRVTYANMDGTGVAAGWDGLGKFTSNGGGVIELQYLWANADDKVSAQKSQFGISLRRVIESFSKDGYTFRGDHYELGAALYY